MSGAPHDQVQTLLRFLTHDAKVPLAIAMSKCMLLHTKGLVTPQEIAASSPDALKLILTDDKLTKQIHSAAKRISNTKKRTAPEDSASTSNKAQKYETHEETERAAEARLILPDSDMSVEELRTITITTNRAPLFLAFAVTVAKYTLPDLPLSSRLSLAQAATSAGAQVKAKAIGLVKTTAEDDGWTEGQPKLRLMGRDIAVMRRQIYTAATNENLQDFARVNSQTIPREAFWGIDLEALRKSNTSVVAGAMRGSSGPPIHQPETAKSYLLKSVDLADETEDLADEPSDIKIERDVTNAEPKHNRDRIPRKSQGLTAAGIKQRKENAAAMLLSCIEHVCQSWSPAVSADELDRKAISWYMRVRPQILEGKAGWGQRGHVKLQDILALVRTTP